MQSAQQNSPDGFGGVDIDRAGMVPEAIKDQGEVGALQLQFAGPGLREGGCSGEEQVFLSIVAKPNGDGEGPEYFGNEFCNGGAKLCLLQAPRRTFGEIPPDKPVIVQGLVKMAAHESSGA